ncbi:hypothetical protein A3C87_00935 [Candidatus Kaiserbacteria bacterium RIFCSPHIGHO2_02_FULL_49_34]|uniref:GGDEF domain-containing protein n=1 Tax=Candidatus Kaiserbacteria bacterium RIFCSPHIGHO2_02_FULL_49_34 TaxID=1798491 RepID=A0A1F6DMS5_9BACT|nr:MAG: hypothetical protein A3C87_00935 [Candidatus Kaiserbacteria bacterium RIFCSPHIGHO2_02_FULL_49_34]
MNLEKPTSPENNELSPEAKIAQMQERINALEAKNHELKLENQKLERIATLDPLTETLNRRGLEMQFEKFLRNAERNKVPADYSVVFIDLKGLKAINDTRGHEAGDILIQNAAETLKSHLRPSDLCARWGGDEFVLVLPKTDEAGARVLTERITTHLPEGLYFRSGIASSTDLEHTYGRAPTLDEVITTADDLSNDARGAESRTNFKMQSDTMNLGDVLKS